MQVYWQCVYNSIYQRIPWYQLIKNQAAINYGNMGDEERGWGKATESETMYGHVVCDWFLGCRVLTVIWDCRYVFLRSALTGFSNICLNSWQSLGILSLQASLTTLKLMAGRSGISMSSNTDGEMPLSLAGWLSRESHPLYPFKMSGVVRPAGPFCMNSIICLQFLFSQQNCIKGLCRSLSSAHRTPTPCRWYPAWETWGNIVQAPLWYSGNIFCSLRCLFRTEGECRMKQLNSWLLQ